MRPTVKRWLKSTLCALHPLFPKREIAILHGRPDYEDNVVALEHRLRTTQLKEIVLVLSSAATLPPKPLGPRTRVVATYSVRGLVKFLTAKYVFFTHSTYTPRFPRGVVSVNVWHGMPVKRVGWMIDEGPEMTVAQYSVATSPLWADIVQESFRPTRATLVTGLPRNDRLLTSDPGLGERLGYEPGSCEKLIAWLPTFRSSSGGPGGAIERRHPLGIPPDRLPDLNDLLERHRAVCVVKPHPLAARESRHEWSRIRFVSEDWLYEQRLTLYEFLGTTDALISDISSVYVDYLILDRPIIHHFPDLREYESSRGFSVEPIEDYLAGPTTADADELLAALADVLENRDTHAAARRRVTALCHTHVDDRATDRLVKQLGLADR
jgi:CDP-glycerol glycerophosphotransferase